MTTRRRPWWPHVGGGRVEVLEPGECRRLLSATSVGRLAYNTPMGPRIVPLNFVVAADRIVVRTAIETEAARWAPGQPAAFEVDQTDEFLQSGWSVLATGVAEQLTVDLVMALDIDQTPDPWAGGVRSLFLSVPLAGVTGRRVHPS